MKITIVQVAFLPVPPQLGGAVEKIWFELGKYFAALAHTVIHISRSYAELPATEFINGVTHVRVPGFDSPSSQIFRQPKDFIYSFSVFKELPLAGILITNTFWLPILLRTKKYCLRNVHLVGNAFWWLKMGRL